MVNDGDDSYFDLSVQGAWIDRLRARLPYSFKSIGKQTNGTELENETTGFVLSEPVLRAGAERHNFWRRGHLFYTVGKLIDCYSTGQIWQRYRMQIGL